MSITPLYKDAKPPQSKADDANAGLWFERFFNQYSSNWQLDVSAKTNFLKQFSSDNNSGSCGDNQQLKVHYLRQRRLISQQQGEYSVFQSDWHFITGMGNNHPVENGMLWHTSLAVPYLAGSSVKGMVRSFMEQQNPNDERIYQWFGSDDKDSQAQQKPTKSGQIIFYDAFPTQRVNLVLDVMTPHTGAWLSEGGINNVPADWHDPIPVFFLSCKKIKLFFSIAKMPHADNNIDLKDVWQCLSDALDFIGAGAKTATGYGFMQEKEKAKADIEEDAKQQQKEFAKTNMSKNELVIFELKENLADYNSPQGEKNPERFKQTLKTTIILAVTPETEWPSSEKEILKALAIEIYKILKVDIKKKAKKGKEGAKELLKKLN